MGQVCSVLREKFLGSKHSPIDPSSVLITDDNTESQNSGQVDIEVQETPGIEVETQIVCHNTNAFPSTPVETLINITDVLPSESKTISECVTPRPPLKTFRERSNSTSSDQDSKKIKVDDYFNFPIFKDSSTKQFISKSKMMVVLRGVSGSGKSHIASQLINLYGDIAVECSADTFFVQPDGRYEFDFTKLKDAHEYCFNLAKTQMSSGRPLVIINNTNVKSWEYKRYLSLAKEHHYLVLLMIPQTPWAWDPALLAQRTQHDVGEEILKAKVSQFQRAQPVYYSWFLNQADSSLLVQRSWACLRALAELPQCRCSLAHFCYRTAPDHMQGGASELATYYKQCGADGTFQLLHCTAMFANRGKVVGADEYDKRVQADMGRAFTLLVTGFVITPRTIGARVVLPDEALQLWEQDDQEDANPPQNVEDLFALVRGEGLGHQALEEEGALDVSFDAGQLTVDVPYGDHSTATTRPVPFERVQQLCGDEGPFLHRQRPFRRQGGRRAHLTVAVAPNVSAVTTGFDLMQLARLEDAATEQQSNPGHGRAAAGHGSSGAEQERMEVDSEGESPRKERQLHVVQGGTLADYGEGVFAFYPDECLEFTTLFSGGY